MKFLQAGLIVTIFMGAAYGLWKMVLGNQPQPCVPFAQTEVPDENDGNWKIIGTSEEYAKDGNSNSRITATHTYYYHKNKKGLALGVHSLFDTIVVKAWSCTTSDATIMLLLKTGWHEVLKSERIIFDRIENGNGDWVGAEIQLLERESNKIIATRTITRPN